MGYDFTEKVYRIFKRGNGTFGIETAYVTFYGKNNNDTKPYNTLEEAESALEDIILSDREKIKEELSKQAVEFYEPKISCVDLDTMRLSRIRKWGV